MAVFVSTSLCTHKHRKASGAITVLSFLNRNYDRVQRGNGHGKLIKCRAKSPYDPLIGSKSPNFPEFAHIFKKRNAKSNHVHRITYIVNAQPANALQPVHIHDVWHAIRSYDMLLVPDGSH